MGAAATNCSACTMASAAGDAAAHGRESGGPELQPRVNMQVKFGGFTVADMVAENRGELGEFYTVQKDTPLGEGAFSTVYRCTNKETKQERAVKSINRKLLRSSLQTEDEIRLMKLLDHPNIARLSESFEDSRFVHLVLELCSGGELFDQVVDSSPFAERPCALCFRQMLRAVCYLHNNHIIHRDLKAENWLLAEQLPLEKAPIKLVDFGTARRLDPGDSCETKIGTPYYVAPEVIQGKYTEKADIWSIGIVLHMLITGIPPFGGKNTKEVLDKIKEATKVHVDRLGKTVTPEGKRILTALLTIDPGDRLSAADALQHAWFPKVLKNETEQNAAITRPSLTLMKNFGKAGKLEKFALAAVTSQMSREAIADLEQAFIAMDANGDGTLSPGELSRGLQNCGMKMEEADVKKLLEQIDTDGSGAIDYSEFIAATLDQSRYMREDACFKAFKVFDLDGSGFIDRAELGKLVNCEEVKKSFANNSLDDVETAYKNLDLNSDGKIDFDEFMAMMYHLNRTA